MVSDDRVERAWDLAALERIRDHAEPWHQQVGGGADWLPKAFSWTTIQHQRLPHDWFGYVVGLDPTTPEARWTISLNDRLPVVAANATLGHEIAHALLPEGLKGAHCKPRQRLTVIEQTAHAGGSLLTVPLHSVRGLRLGDREARRLIAADLGVPRTFVQIRTALAVFLGETRGDHRDASAYLNGGLLSHQSWMAGIADWMAAQAE